MKKEIIEALCKAIAPTTPTDSRERGSVASLLMAVGKKLEQPMTAAELARLVDLRIRQRKDRDTITPDKIVEEIESTLDLVGMCEFMLEARRRRAKQTQSDMFEVALVKAPTEKEKQIKAAIEGERYPLDFATSLIRMGVPGDSHKKRVAKWWEFFRHAYSMEQFMQSGAHSSGYEHFKQLPEAELRRAFEKEKTTIWPNADVLWLTAQNWLSWHQRQIQEIRRAAGVASGEKRKPKPKGGK